MPRYDDHYGATRVYVGRLSSRTRSRDLEDLFNRYGRVRDVDMKYDYAFVEFSDPRDADDAVYGLNGRDIDGSRIIVEIAKGGPRGSGPSGGSRDLGRGPAPGTGRCFNCGLDGHWARDCKAGDWKNKCYRCGDRGHVERNCKNSPKKLRRGRSYSRSPPRRGRNRSPSLSRSRSYSGSRSPPPKRDRSVDKKTERRRSRSLSYSRSPQKRNKALPSPSLSPSPASNGDGRRRSPKEISQSPPPPKREKENGSGYSRSPSPRGTYPTPSPSPRRGGERSPPYEENGHSPSHSPTMARDDEKSPPPAYEDDQNRDSPRG